MRMEHFRDNSARESKITAESIANWLRLFIAPGQVTELRALRVSMSEHRRPHTRAGFFAGDETGLMVMAKRALDVSRHAKGVYFVMNPLQPEIRARSADQLKVAESGDLAGDQHVVRRRWLLIDIDPVRLSGISATDQEKVAAFDVVHAVRRHLDGLRWPAPILADSGNGYHLFYRIDLPTDDGGVVARCLKALANRFETERAKVDTTVHNPARIVKVPGTWARKGDSTPDRPHRRGSILEVPVCQ
jgi:hypothetical protein